LDCGGRWHHLKRRLNTAAAARRKSLAFDDPDVVSQTMGVVGYTADARTWSVLAGANFVSDALFRCPAHGMKDLVVRLGVIQL
jgi:hypothetical protein